MITANFYKFSKKENSTARPTGSGNAIDIEIKSASSIFFPYIVVNRGASTAAPGYNYCYISNFSRYYWITEWIWNNGLWEASLKCDVLATYKSVIGDTSLYALRAANSYDGSIVDNLYPTKSGCSYSDVTMVNPFDSMTNGFFVIGIASLKGDFGSICYYALDRSALATFISTLLSDTFLTNNGFSVSDASIALQKSLIDPLQYIKSCVYIPLKMTEYPSELQAATSIKIFDWDIPVTCKIVSKLLPYVYTYQTVNIPKHPQISSRGNFVTLAPYSNYQIYVPPFGLLSLDSTSLSNSTTLTVNLYIDLPTGLGTIKIVNDAEYTLSRIESQVGVQVQLSQIMPDMAGAIMNTVGALGTAASGNLGGALASLGSAAMSMIPSVNSVGSGGSYVQLEEIWQLEGKFFSVVNDDITHNGRPLCQMIQPKNINGYMLIQDGDVAIDGTQEESQEIKRYLETGFFYE